MEAGKNLGRDQNGNDQRTLNNQSQSQQTPDHHTSQFPIYVIEFKAGRRDFFYLDVPSQNIKTGDLVIVEADRGKDLGKVICDNLMSMESVSNYQTNHPDILSESPYGGKEITPKKVYRRATGNEVSLVCLLFLDGYF